MNWADRIRHLRSLLACPTCGHQATQEDLARRLGVSWATVQRWEAGTSTTPQHAIRTRVERLEADTVHSLLQNRTSTKARPR